MNLTFSAHALDRCFERRISLHGVLDALRQGTCVKGNGMKDGERFVMAHGRLKVVAEFEGPACVVISAWRDQKGSKRAARERRQRLRRPGPPDKRGWPGPLSGPGAGPAPL